MSAVAVEPRELTWREKIEAIIEVCRDLGARRAWVFGSAARGEAGEWSDLDVIVEHETEDSVSTREAAERIVKLVASVLDELDGRNTGTG